MYLIHAVLVSLVGSVILGLFGVNSLLIHALWGIGVGIHFGAKAIKLDDDERDSFK